MRVEFGFCPCCDQEIATKCPTCEVRKPNEHYTEVLVRMTSGSKMVLACCGACATDNKLFQMDKQELMDAVKIGWRKKLTNSPKEVQQKHEDTVKDYAFA